MKPGPHEITKVLKDWTSGDQTALDKLMPTETAEVLEVSPGMVMCDWTFARVWPRNEMSVK